MLVNLPNPPDEVSVPTLTKESCPVLEESEIQKYKHKERFT